MQSDSIDTGLAPKSIPTMIVPTRGVEPQRAGIGTPRLTVMGYQIDLTS
ncbi:MAG: hypothetical protein IKH08_02215 [Prevotella sp.]|nr:hypothetical protein [Prevotella sp.]